MLIGGALLVEQACVIVWWCFMFSLQLFICCSIVLCGLPSPICLLPSGTVCLTLVIMAYYFMGFFLTSFIWLLPNDSVHFIIQHPTWFIFGDSFSSFPYLYCYLVVLFLFMLQLDGVFPLPCFTQCSMPSCYYLVAFFHFIVHVLFMLSGDFIFHIVF
jgi:hypothetical protein